MRSIIEDAAIIYREELDGLFSLVAPGVILGPVGLIIASTGTRAALAMVPCIILLYLVTSVACLNWAGYQLTSSHRSLGPTLAILLRGAPDIVVSTGPALLVLAVAAGCGVFMADQGFAVLSLPLTAAAGCAVAYWLSRHAYELPLVVVYGADARQAREATARLDSEGRQWTLRLLTAVAAPMVVVALAGILLALAIAPVVGAAVFLLAGTLWLPFASLCMVGACERLLREAAPARAEPALHPAR